MSRFGDTFIFSFSRFLVPKLQLGNASLRSSASRSVLIDVQHQHRLYAGGPNVTRSRYKIFETEYPYFLTHTIVEWLPIFTRKEAVEIVLEAWRYHQRESALQILGFVVLENHLHLIARAPNLSNVLKSVKSFTAHQIIDLLERRGEDVVLRQLKAHKSGHKTESTYQVWQEGSHPQQIQDDDMMWQKLEYTHNNPVTRGYVDDPVHWRYSSARNYARQPGLIEVVTDWM